ALAVAAAEHEFLSEFAFQAVEVHRLAHAVVSLVDRVDVAADAEAATGDEAFFTRAAAAAVAKVAALVAEDRIGDELLVGRVLLGGGALHEKVRARCQHGVQVAFGVGLETLEAAEFVEEGAGDDKNVFHEAVSLAGA